MIIFINGSVYSGKSTTAKLLAKKLSNCAIVEIDRFHEFIEWLDIDKAIPINLENGLSVVRNFLKHKYNVIIPYPMSKKNYDFWMKNLNKYKKEIFIFTLNPDMNVILKNRGKRKLDDWDKNRIKYHYKIGINKPSFGTSIDNTNQTPEETAEQIFKHLQK